MKNAIGGAVVALVGVAWVKLYGDYKYACGRKDAGDFYKPIIDALNDQNKTLCKKLKEEEKA